MNLRTTFTIEPSARRITCNDRVMLIGSCFAGSIGAQMKKGKLAVLINPAGTVYNPVSVSNTLDIITEGREFKKEDLYYHNGMWISFFHYTDFSSEDPERALEKINISLRSAAEFLDKTGFLFITFGTARVYRLKETGLVVSNCHRVPASRFSPELLKVNEITGLWKKQLDRLQSLYPELKVVFTISPVRHLKDGAHGNQVSKSTLFLAVEELLQHSSGPQYFPAYELVMDDLRDYRFYDDDMVHQSDTAINYIWEAFTECYFEKETISVWNEASKISAAMAHRFHSDSRAGKKIFAGKLLDQISELERRIPSVDFSYERNYFTDLLNENS